MLTLEELPDDILTLKQKILELTENSQKTIEALKSEIQDYRRILFGVKSEKMSQNEYEQSLLFDEAEHGLNDESELFEALKEIDVKDHKRQVGRKKLPANLPRVEIIHDITDEEKTCNCGCAMCHIGNDVSENLVMKPSQLYVEKHICKKYACQNCEGDERDEAGTIVVTAKKPEVILPKSNLSPQLLAYVLISKFVDHIPFLSDEQNFL